MYSGDERPLPVDFIHPNGGRARIEFTWGDPKKNVPTEISVWIKVGESYVKLGKKSCEWNTFREAKIYGTDLALKYLSR